MRYFAMIEGERRGPYTLEELTAAGVRPDTYVWCKGMDDWRRASEVGDICRHFRRRLHALSHPEPPAPETPVKDTPSLPDDDDEGLPLRFRGLVKGNVDVERRPEAGPDMSLPPKSWLAEALLALILCCPATGIVALWHSLRCRTLWRRGERAEAYRAAARARLWVLITVVAGCFMAAFAGRLAGLFR